MTIGEAMEQVKAKGLNIERRDRTCTSWIVTLKDWSSEQKHKYRYITKSLEDAVFVGSEMRAVQNTSPHVFM